MRAVCEAFATTMRLYSLRRDDDQQLPPVHESAHPAAASQGAVRADLPGEHLNHADE
jgi:hypothetical protein